MVSVVVLLAADPFSRGPAPLLMPGAGLFFLILAVGLAGSPGNATYDIAKDVWYVGNALLTLLLGYLIVRRTKDVQAIFLTMALAAAVVSLAHVMHFVIDPSLLLQSLTDIRAQAGTGYLISAVGVTLALADLRFRLGIFRSRWLLGAVAVLCLASIVLSLSRTAWLVLLTLTSVTALNVSFSNLVRAGAALIPAIALLLMAAELDLPAEGPAESPTFSQKVSASLRELRVSEYETKAEINRHWRGFESYRSLQEYGAGSTLGRIFGKGFGSFVDLGFIMTLADEEFDRIPVLHNGYLYLLVKTGLAGLTAYLLYLVLLFRRGRLLTSMPDAQTRFSGLLLIALTVVMIETTLVIAGMFNRDWVYPATLLTGVLLGHSESVPRKDGRGHDDGAAAPGAA
ncbi:MAG: hypothetical protein A2010_10690 [Nitrospirae bacterium GWD2_57_9]|nr:MAG: hypothetical protein A2010_10690 [Nitrospirae bacterium GWD2_57_9]OGW46968.1 MAG: hypothetical protein A2078_11215 [Nitrospirae bacterium GWC2_57_9]